MILYHIRQVNIADNVAIRKHDVVGGYVSYGIIDVFQRFKACGIDRRCRRTRRNVRRNYLDPARTASQVPILARADMVHKRLIIVLRNYSDIRYI